MVVVALGVVLIIHLTVLTADVEVAEEADALAVVVVAAAGVQVAEVVAAGAAVGVAKPFYRANLLMLPLKLGIETRTLHQ